MGLSCQPRLIRESQFDGEKVWESPKVNWILEIEAWSLGLPTGTATAKQKSRRRKSTYVENAWKSWRAQRVHWSSSYLRRKRKRQVWLTAYETGSKVNLSVVVESCSFFPWMDENPDETFGSCGNFKWNAKFFYFFNTMKKGFLVRAIAADLPF